MGINVCILEGRLTKDPELRRTQNGTEVATSSLAVLKPNGTDTDFLDLVAWRESAKNFATYRKGQRVIIESEVTTRTWTDKTTGANRRNVEFIVHSIRALAVRSREDQPAAPQAFAAPTPAAQPPESAPVPAAPVDPNYAIPDEP